MKLVIQLVRVVGEELLFHPDDGVGCLALRVVQAGDLVVDGPEGLVETLIVGVGLLDVAQVQLSVEGGGVAGLGEHFGHGDVLGREARVLDRETDLVGARADCKLPCQRCSTTRRAAGLGVHAREDHAFFGQCD